MAILSDAVIESARSAVVGYKITKGDYANESPNLPQRIAILSEANTNKQTGLSLDPFIATSISKIAEKLGAGSPAYMAMRILIPMQGGGIGGIPIVVYPVTTAVGATATVKTVTVTGTATKNATHRILIAGRPTLDGQPYAINIVKGDTSDQIALKAVNAVNAVYGSPVIAAHGTTGTFSLTSVIKGISSIFALSFDIQNVDAGISYSIVNTAVGSGIGDVATALGKFQNDWNTLVLNPYGDETTILDLMESVNGRPDPENPTGRFSGIIFKPFLSFFSKSTTDPLTDEVLTARVNECTNVYCPAPNVDQMPIETVANVVSLVAQIAQNTPNLDVNDQAYPDTVVNSTSIGNYSDYNYRDEALKAGLSTVDLVGSDLIIKDLITTYNPSNEVIPQFRYCRNLILDFNIRYTYLLLEQINVVNHTLVPDGTITSAEKTISPSQWKGIVSKMFDSLADRGLIADASFSKNSLTVKISSTNPDRFETFFRYKRTGIARICSTTAEAGFYYGS